MTTIVRRKPKPVSQVIELRVTTSGRVSSLPSPIQALWAEALGRATEPQAGHPGQVEGLCVAIAVLWCQPLEVVRDELARRVGERMCHLASSAGARAPVT